MASSLTTQLLIIGAGPFGLAASARAKARGIEHSVVGLPFSFWRDHMPQGMFLRSGYDWHIDPQEDLTFDRFLHVQNLEAVSPIPLRTFLDYGDWFVQESGIRVRKSFVTRLVKSEISGDFVADLDDGTQIATPAVLCAPGFWPFRNLPTDLGTQVPQRHRRHSAALAGFKSFNGRRCLIIGGRQSAFETAVLLAEQGAAEVSVVHRHPTPVFAPSDWSWVAGDLKSAEASPGWFADQPSEIRESIQRRFWEEGRLKLEPWLGQRLERLDVSVFQNTILRKVLPLRDGSYRGYLQGDFETLIEFDELILATGFVVDVTRIEYLNSLTASLHVVDGFPALSSDFESAGVPGLYFVGLVAARQFGPYMGFLASCPFAARRVVDTVAARAMAA